MDTGLVGLLGTDGGGSVRRGHVEDIAHLVVSGPGPQLGARSVDLVTHNPAGRDPAGDGPGDHRPSQRRLRGEGDLVGHARSLASCRVLDPAARQVEGPVDEGVASVGDQSGKHPDLGVLGPPGGAGVLALHADRSGALLQIAGLVDHQHRPLPGGDELLDSEGPKVVPDAIGIPDSPGQQMLKAIRCPMTGVLSDRPAVLAFQVRRQTNDQIAGVTQCLDPSEPGRNPAHEPPEQRGPAHRVHYAHRRGHRHGSLLVHRRKTLTRWPPRVRHPRKKTYPSAP